jgi:CO/xanthine dehydrogenase Mo-binding subunit
VTVDRTTGAVKVDHVWVAHDCGQVINPDGLRNQIEGNVVQTTSRTLIEKLTFSRSAVTSLNWATYPILTFPDVPEVTIELIDRPEEVPWGAGEPTTSAVPAAIANAVFDATGADPLEMRLRHLDDPRGIDLLERLARLANWEPRASRPREPGAVSRGRGLSYTKYELVRTYVGIVADVTVDRTTGAVKVDHVWVAHDCGQVINPDGLRNQIEGNVVQTTSRTLIEKLTFSRSAVTSLNWATYPILTFPDVPEVTIELIDRPEEVPWGAGEPTTSAVPAAIANAVFDATGARLRSVPFRPDAVLAALDAVGAR